MLDTGLQEEVGSKETGNSQAASVDGLEQIVEEFDAPKELHLVQSDGAKAATELAPTTPESPQINTPRVGPTMAPCDFCWYFGDKTPKLTVVLDGLDMCRPCCLGYVEIND